MALEGEFPKSDGDVWFGSDANVVNKQAIISLNHLNEKVSSFLQINQNIFTTDFADSSWGATVTGLTRRTKLEEWTKHDTSAYTFVTLPIPVGKTVTQIHPYLDFEVFTESDECDNSVVDGNWTTISGSLVEGTDGMAANGTSTGRYIDLSSEAFLSVGYDLRPIPNGASSATAIFRVTDGTNVQTIDSLGVTGTSSTRSRAGTARFYLDFPNKKLIFVKKVTGEGITGIETTTTIIDLTGWTTFQFEFESINSTFGTTQSVCKFIRTVNASPTATTILAISTDGGSNFTNATNGQTTKLGTPGTSIVFRLTGSGVDGEVINIKGMSFNIVS